MLCEDGRRELNQLYFNKNKKKMKAEIKVMLLHDRELQKLLANRQKLVRGTEQILPDSLLKEPTWPTS